MRYPWILVVVMGGILAMPRSLACCAVTIARGSVVNADQTVIILWDPKSRMQHFIREANFKTDAKDVGFIVPSPSRPQLEESGGKAFATLKEITRPYVMSPSFSIGCSAGGVPVRESTVRVIEEKRVAGYDATVLTAGRGDDLVEWLKANGYPYSTETAEWARPYLGGNWHFTVLKVAKKEGASKDIKASALRISFQTDRPLFPYREPDSSAASRNLGVSDRLLRIYFISDARYRGEIDGGRAWSGKAVWSDDISGDRERLLRELKLPTGTGPEKWVLTEFEDRWPYAKAAGDVYFRRDANQGKLDVRSFGERPVDPTMVGMMVIGCLYPMRRVIGNISK